MEVLGVAYHWTPARQAQWQRWADRLGARLTLLHTHPDRADQPNYVGNTHFEFTAFAAAARHAQTDGPYVVVNDTLFRSHASALWAQWLLASCFSLNAAGRGARRLLVSCFSLNAAGRGARRLLVSCFSLNAAGRGAQSQPGTSKEKPPSGVYCDVYPAPRERPVEIPDPYASSWIFYLPTRADLETLSAAVQQVVSQPAAEPSPAYQAFLDRWLNHPVPGVGYQGPRSPEDLARKRQTIVWEHSLSRFLVSSYQLRAFSGPTYRALRFIDKVLRRIQVLETRNQKLVTDRNQKLVTDRNQKLVTDRNP